MKRTCKQIRSEFIDFFVQRGHTAMPSSSLLPAEDPTLLFTNAGMNQFKDIFLGRETRDYVRAVNSQKCIRAGGKHNDLEDVGHDAYHHTFFEMLGNWSFGDYFKADAIRWAWELLAKVWGLPKDRLHVTVFEGDAAEGLAADEEAKDQWRQVTDIDPSHIHLGNKKDNFWEMGDTGPCGPCSEIHYDFTSDLSGASLVNQGDPRVVEIWNLVFIQFNRDESGRLSPLPASHVDTGMGLERISRILQGVDSNYGIDVFRGLFDVIHEVGASQPYAGSMEDIHDVAYRVIADHARALTFAIADGVIPSNEGRGYVLRRILRRACRYGRQYLGLGGAFLVDLVPTVVKLMGEAFPELAQRQQYVMETVEAEEDSFGRTLGRGIELFQKQADKLRSAGAKELPGEIAFDLYATYGFPVDLTQIMAREQGLSVDMAGFQEQMKSHRELSGAGGAFKADQIAGLPATDDSAKYSREPVQATVLGWVIDSKFQTDGKLEAGVEAAVVLDRTNFYGEQGGQVGDTGELEFEGGGLRVKDTAVAGRCVLHVGVVTGGKLAAGQKVLARVDATRLDTMRNHTATHLLNWALREVLGEHIHQAGSVVAPDRLRFDFTHNQAVTDEQLVEIERLANDRVLADERIELKTLPLSEAKKIHGVRAVFGEKYPDPVRVVMTGRGGSSVSAEFCGGTHLDRTGQLGLFKIVAEESVAKGVRRITALTGREAVAHVQQADKVLKACSAALRVPAEQVPERIEALQKDVKALKKRPAAAASQEFQAELAAETPAGKVLVAHVGTADPAAMRTLCDVQRQKGAAAVLVGGAEDGKVTLVAMVSDELVKGGKLKAGDWVKAAAAVVGGSGGGKPTLAQAGGKHPEKLPQALQAAAEYARRQLA